MIPSCRFPFSFDTSMQNYTVYDAFTNRISKKENMAAGTLPTNPRWLQHQMPTRSGKDQN